LGKFPRKSSMKLRDKLGKIIAKSMLENPEITDMLRKSFVKRRKEIKSTLIDRKLGLDVGGIPTEQELKERFARAISHESYKMADEILKIIGEQK